MYFLYAFYFILRYTCIMPLFKVHRTYVVGVSVNFVDRADVADFRNWTVKRMKIYLELKLAEMKTVAKCILGVPHPEKIDPL